MLAENAESILDTEFPHPRTARLPGNEHRGLSETAETLADCKLKIPMRGMVQNLNLSLTAALCLFEPTRQRSAPGIDGSGNPAVKQQALVENSLDRSS